jgi:hypothetical protein
MFWKKKSRHKYPLIGVRPKNYRSIVLHAIENCTNPIIWLDGVRIDDFSENGLIVQKIIRKSTDFLIKDGDEEVLGFHVHPNHMWISEKYKHIAEYCAKEGWLKIEK